MPIQFKIDRSKDLTVFKLSGEVPFSDFLATLNEYGQSKPTRYELYDAQELTGELLTTEEMQRLSRYLSVHADKRPLDSKTIIVVNKELDFGLSRMISSLTDGQVPYQIEVCRSLEEARRALDES